MHLKTKASPLRVVRPPATNMLRASLAPDDLALISSELEPVALVMREILYEAGAEIEYVYFPTTGCVSMIHTIDGGSVEVGTIGLEWFAGVPGLMRATSAAAQAPVPGQGLA